MTLMALQSFRGTKAWATPMLQRTKISIRLVSSTCMNCSATTRHVDLPEKTQSLGATINCVDLSPIKASMEKYIREEKVRSTVETMHFQYRERDTYCAR